ncbi:MAG TPA: helix-turn-helix domain-containing protein [Candidatus Saccharimonadales bacterium]|nr:helix-turn-helix domain-containing protein [Candidatus Saccharimonadales bacterium]
MKDRLGVSEKLEYLGLTKDEVAIFMQLLDAPKTHLEISRATGIVRSNVYRIVDSMISKGLVAQYANDAAKLLAVAQPEALELLVLEQEQLAQERRNQLGQILPILAGHKTDADDFSIKTYVGVAGIKQMLWNELKAKSEILLFSGDVMDRATGRRWAERFRAEVVRRGLRTRGIQNVKDRGITLSDQKGYGEHYRARYLEEDFLHIQFEMSIYDNKVGIYSSLAHSQLGTEISNPFLAKFMRQIFEHYWTIAKP